MGAGGVLLLDDDEDLLATLSELLALLTGRPCLALASVAQLIEHREQALGCGLALLDINLGPQQPSGLDAFAWLRSERFAGRIAFLTGHARSHPIVARACALDDADVYQKPIDLDELRQLLSPVLLRMAT